MGRSEDGSTSAALTPKKLYKLCAEKYADSIAVRALPALELYLCEDELYQPDFPSRMHVTEYLKQLKRNFAEDTHEWLGSTSSTLRVLVNQCLTDVLDFHSEVQDAPRDRQLVALLMFQMLFQDEAGKLPATRIYEADHLLPRLKEFLKTFGPFPIKSFYQDISFDDPADLAMIFKYLPSLQCVQLDLCYSQCILESLKENCPLLEEISIEISNCEHVPDKNETFCQIFFGLNLQQVLKKLQNEEAVHLTFPKVNKLYFYSITDRFWPLPHNFIFLFKHFCPDAKIKWHYTVIDEELVESTANYGVLCPYFVRSEEVSLDVLAFNLNLILQHDTNAGDVPHAPMFLKANYIDFEDFHADVPNTPSLISALLQNFSCRKLKLSYNSDTSFRLTSNLVDIGQGLVELYLEGPCLDVNDGIQLCDTLNQCANLVVLSLKLDLKQDPMWGRLVNFPKLKALSFIVENFPNWDKFPLYRATGRGFDNLVVQYMKENSMYGNLPAYLNFRDLSPIKFTSNLYNLCKLMERLPQFGNIGMNCEDMTQTIFGEGSLRYHVLSSSKLKMYGNNDEQNQDSRASPSCRNGIPKFAFYNNPNYDNRVLNNGQTIESIIAMSLKPFSICSGHNDSEVTHSKAGNTNAPCDRLSTTLQKTTPYNKKNQQYENELQQWRPDMMFRAPIMMLLSLIKSSPNLKLLEIPDLRIHDPFYFICDSQVVANLSNVHTIHLSCQFSKPLLVSMLNIKSLKTMMISQEYGMDNYLRFRRAFRNTNLEVRLSSNLVYPGSVHLKNL